MNWLRILVLTVVALAAATYLGDWAVFKFRGSPSAKITVSHFVSAPLKNNKQEIDYLGSEETPCSISMFPQAGENPCWYLRDHRNQTTTY